ncbi:MAG: DNA primase [Arcticibacter sp.]
MISKETIDQIMSAVRVEEVVGDFISLKKRGVNLLGICPFHNEKTPSFNVSPVRGIYKCFGCGKGGNAVNFIMEHEHYSYPEALRYLARRYNIEIQEEERTPEFDQEQMERESLLAVTEYASKFFIKQLHETDEGRSVGLSYFSERGFTDEMIERFQLGYSPEEWRAFTDDAVAAGYKLEKLEKTGMTVVNGDKKFDRFRGRVMFPIHNVAGKVIGFGGRILKTDAKAAKYLNSPESDIYHKSKVLYGLYQSRKAIVEKDVCYLVEGYTDVISMHQSGITNVVASSGTALTQDQIRLIRRYTKNITILYDGDTAGIKASLRGIDLILEEGMNVRVVLFPDGDDPDSFSRKHTTTEIVAYIKENAKDFIRFKTSLLLKDVGNDPIGRAGLIREIVETIALIPDAIIRSTYVRECSNLMQIGEDVLMSELTRIVRKKVFKDAANESQPQSPIDDIPLEKLIIDERDPEILNRSEHQEADIIRLLLNFADEMVIFPTQYEEDGRTHTVNVEEQVKSVIVHDLEPDDIAFENPTYGAIYQMFRSQVHENRPHVEGDFINHSDSEISRMAAHFLTIQYPLANWEDRGIFVKDESKKLAHSIFSALYSFKIKHVERLSHSNREAIKAAAENGEDVEPLLDKQMNLDRLRSSLSAYLSIVVLR